MKLSKQTTIQDNRNDVKVDGNETKKQQLEKSSYKENDVSNMSIDLVNECGDYIGNIDKKCYCCDNHSCCLSCCNHKGNCQKHERCYHRYFCNSPSCQHDCICCEPVDCCNECCSQKCCGKKCYCDDCCAQKCEKPFCCYERCSNPKCKRRCCCFPCCDHKCKCCKPEYCWDTTRFQKCCYKKFCCNPYSSQKCCCEKPSYYFPPCRGHEYKGCKPDCCCDSCCSQKFCYKKFCCDPCCSQKYHCKKPCRCNECCCKRRFCCSPSCVYKCSCCEPECGCDECFRHKCRCEKFCCHPCCVRKYCCEKPCFCYEQCCIPNHKCCKRRCCCSPSCDNKFKCCKHKCCCDKCCSRKTFCKKPCLVEKIAYDCDDDESDSCECGSSDCESSRCEKYKNEYVICSESCYLPSHPPSRCCLDPCCRLTNNSSRQSPNSQPESKINKKKFKEEFLKISRNENAVSECRKDSTNIGKKHECFKNKIRKIYYNPYYYNLYKKNFKEIDHFKRSFDDYQGCCQKNNCCTKNPCSKQKHIKTNYGNYIEPKRMTRREKDFQIRMKISPMTPNWKTFDYGFKRK